MPTDQERLREIAEDGALIREHREFLMELGARLDAPHAPPGDLDHMSDDECRAELEAVYTALEGEHDRLIVHASGETEEPSISYLVAAILREREAPPVVLEDVREAMATAWASYVKGDSHAVFQVHMRLPLALLRVDYDNPWSALAQPAAPAPPSVPAEVRDLQGVLMDLRARFRAMGRRSEECHEMSMIDDALAHSRDATPTVSAEDDLLAEILDEMSAPTLDDERIGYVEVQIARETWTRIKAAQEARREAPPEEPAP